MELTIYPRTYAITLGLTAALLLLSLVPGLRHAHRMDLARVTKEQVT
jgi:hypothetical protein